MKIDTLPLRQGLPGRLDSHLAAQILGFDPFHIPILVARKLIRPLGHPPENAPKYFARDYIVALASDQAWLAKASDSLVAHWKHRNANKQPKGREEGGI
jgi:hypothetical protein